MRPRPLIGVRDLEASRRRDRAHRHGSTSEPRLPPGNRLPLRFEVEDFDAALTRTADGDRKPAPRE